MKLVCSILASASFLLAASAQVPFHAYDSTELLIEGGTVHTLIVDSGTERLTIRMPRGYFASVDKEDQSVVFKEDTGTTAITMRVTTNSPGATPDDDTLRAMALAIHPQENFLQLSSIPTGFKPAPFVDSIHGSDASHSVRSRHAFVACPDGLVEFIFSSKDEAFEDGRIVFNLFMSSFRVEKLITAPKKPPE